MAISPVEVLTPQTPNSLTALLQGGTNTLTSAINNAIQVGRDSVNNQTQQNRDLLSERRAEINLRQRRDENVNDQANADRAFEEQQRQFGIREGRLSAADALRSEKMRLEIEDFKNTKDIRGREVDARLKAIDLQNKKLDQEAEFLPQTLETRRLDAENAQTKALNESLTLARSGEERNKISEFSDALKQSSDAYQRGLGEIENDSSLTAAQKQSALVKLREGLNEDMEAISRMSAGEGISPDTTKTLLSMQKTFMEGQGFTPDKSTRDASISESKDFTTLRELFEDKTVFASVFEEDKAINSQSEEFYVDNFGDPSLTKKQRAARKGAGVDAIRRKRLKAYRLHKKRGSAAQKRFVHSVSSQGGTGAAALLSELVPRK